MGHLQYRSIDDFAAMSVEDAHALTIAACELHGAARSGTARRVLQGRNLALLCGAAALESRAAATFHRAASELGATVAQLPSSLDEDSTPEQVRRTAHLLGRLYDGIECIGLPSGLVRHIGAEAGVPVFEAISSCDHPTRRLADALADDCRCSVMQAVLIAALR